MFLVSEDAPFFFFFFFRSGMLKSLSAESAGQHNSFHGDHVSKNQPGMKPSLCLSAYKIENSVWNPCRAQKKKTDKNRRSQLYVEVKTSWKKEFNPPSKLDLQTKKKHCINLASSYKTGRLWWPLNFPAVLGIISRPVRFSFFWKQAILHNWQ